MVALPASPLHGEAGAGSGEGRRPHRPQGRRLLPLLGGWRPVVAVADMVRLAGIRAGASRPGLLARLVKVDHRAGPRGGRTPARPRAGNGRTGDSFQVCTVPGRTALGVSLGVTPWEPCSQPNVVDGRADPAHPGGAMFLDRAPSAADVGAPPCRRRPRQHLHLSALRPRGRDAPGVVARTGPGAKSSRSPGPMGDPGCACEDAPPDHRPTVKRQPGGRRYGPAIGPAQPRRSTRRNAQEWRATETVVCHRGMAQPYGPPGRRSCSLPVQLPHSWRTWCSLGDPTRSGQPCMGTKGPSRDRRKPH